MPMARQARMMRTAISPRFAISMRWKQGIVRHLLYRMAWREGRVMRAQPRSVHTSVNDARTSACATKEVQRPIGNRAQVKNLPYLQMGSESGAAAEATGFRTASILDSRVF